MNVQVYTKEKRMYQSPLIEFVVLDNEISLSLASIDEGDDTPPSLEGERLTPDYFNNDPYRSNLV